MTDLGADELVGATYRIIPANRIRDIFGEPGGDVSLASGTSEGAADNVILWTGTGFDSAIYYHAAGQWAQGASPANDVVIDRDEGFFVLRRPGNGDAVITVAGEVSSKPQAVVLDAGYNLIGGMSAVDQTLDETELDTVLQDGTSATEADTIVQWLGSGWDSDIYYHTAGAWAKGASPAGTEVLAAGDGYFVKVEGETSKVWRRPSPLQ